ncbi:MAG: hypoxanthine phosphoribosyltransferase [Elusimicrobiota bacterium]
MEKIKQYKEIKKILLTEEQIKKRVTELAEQITSDYKNKNPILVSILKGSIIFLSDLIRQLKIKCSIDFVAISSYEGDTESSGVVRQLLDLRESPVGQDILVIEDIVDTGMTLNYLRNNLLTRNPKSLKICVLLDKKESRKIQVPLDYVGFVIPNEFVVGYGLDYKELYRDLPYIGVL